MSDSSENVENNSAWESEGEEDDFLRDDSFDGNDVYFGGVYLSDIDDSDYNDGDDIWIKNDFRKPV